MVNGHSCATNTPAAYSLCGTMAWYMVQVREKLSFFIEIANTAVSSMPSLAIVHGTRMYKYTQRISVLVQANSELEVRPTIHTAYNASNSTRVLLIWTVLKHRGNQFTNDDLISILQFTFRTNTVVGPELSPTRTSEPGGLFAGTYAESFGEGVGCTLLGKGQEYGTQGRIRALPSVVPGS